MKNLCCCECHLELGCITDCTNFDTTLVAAKAGIYILQYKFNGAWLKVKSATLVIGNPIKFDIRNLIPNYIYAAVVYDPDGVLVDITDTLIEYDCLRFQPVLSI